MAVASITNYLAKESGRLTYDIYQRTLYSSPWLALPKKVAWPQEMGEKVSNVMFERPYLDGDPVAWTALTFNAASNSCIPNADEVKFQTNLREMQLYHKAVHSPRFCVNDLLFTGARQQQMANVVKALQEQVRFHWIERNRDEFSNWSNKVIAEPGLDTNTESVTFLPPGHFYLTTGFSNTFTRLSFLSKAAPAHSEWSPYLHLITDQVSSRRLPGLMMQSAKTGGTPASAILFLSLWVWAIPGFVPCIDDMPPRYTYAGCVYTKGILTSGMEQLIN